MTIMGQVLNIITSLPYNAILLLKTLQVCRVK